jgi:hypothetical protein
MQNQTLKNLEFRLKMLRNDTGVGSNPGQSLRNAGSFLQVDWVGVVL